MTTIVRVVRPYQSEAEFLAAEAWTIDEKSVLLIDQPELASMSLIRFEVTLASGAPLLRAEGTVLRYQRPWGDRPGGLRVKLKRYNAQTKALIIRALETRALQARASEELLRAAAAAAPAQLVAPMFGAESSDACADVAPDSDSEVSQMRPSRVRRVEAPANRDMLLERLRARARHSG